MTTSVTGQSRRLTKPFQPLALYISAATFHVLIVLIVHWYERNPLVPDAAGYDYTSEVLSNLWESGISFTRTPLSSITGTELWGFPFILAAGRHITGGGWLAGKVVVALLAASAAPAAYMLVLATGGSKMKALLAGAAVATSPTLLFWGALGLKDGLVVAFVLWILLLQTRSTLPIASLGTALGIQACLYLRAPAAIALGASLVPRIRPSRWIHSLRAILLCSALVVILIIPRVGTLTSLIATLNIEDGRSLSVAAGTEVAGTFVSPVHIASFLLGPFPWAYGDGTAVPERWLYLGTTLWIALLALAVPATHNAWRQSDGRGRPMLVAMFAYALVYFISFGGAFYRQRAVVEILLLLVVIRWYNTGVGSALKRVTVWLGLVAGVALLQSNDLTPTPLLKLATASALLIVFVTALQGPLIRRLARTASGRSVSPF